MKPNQQTSYLTTSNHTLSPTTTSLSRRTFLGTAAGVMGAASLGLVGAGALAPSAAGAAQAPSRKKEMHLGMLTAPVTGLTLDEVLDLAKRCHVSALEVIAGPGNRQIDPMNFTQADADSSTRNWQSAAWRSAPFPITWMPPLPARRTKCRPSPRK